MTDIEKSLRKQIRVAVPNPHMRRSILLKLTRCVRETRAEDARVFVGEMRRRIDLRGFGVHGIEDEIASLVLTPRRRR